VADSKLEQKPETPQLKTGQETPKVTLAEFLAQQRALQQGRVAANANGLQVALEEQGAAIVQSQQTQSNATTVAGWTSVLATVIATSHLEKEQEQRRALKAIQEQMFELLAKEKEKAKIREAAFFQPLVGILGHSTVEAITQKLEVASVAPGGGLQGNKSVQAQVAQDMAALLKATPADKKITISADEVSAVMNRELSNAVAVLPAQRPALHVVRPEESLALKTHEIIRTLATGEERLLQVQKLRGSLGPEKFAAMVDAYDKKYGVPLIAHIATLSSSNPTTQAEMVHEMKSVLSPAQQQRFTEFGRAEFAQVMAVLDRNREVAERQVKVVDAQMREVEKHLAATLGRAELKDTPASEIRQKLIAEIVKRFPELNGKGFEDIALRLKEVVGEKDEAAQLKLLQGLTGTTKLADPEAMLELATRTTIQMQKLLVLDQQLAAANNTQSKTETGDEAILRKHYAAVFGADATTASPEFARLTSAAKSYTHHLDRRLADPSLSTEERDALIRERDTIDFGYTKKLVAETLSRETPDAQRAVALLSAFSGAHATTELRRGAQVLETARSLSEAIQNADELRREWQGLAPEQFANLQLHKQSGSEVTSAITGRSSTLPELDLATRFAELNAGASGKSPGDGTALLAALATTGDSVTRKQQFDVLAAQREAAQSTKWFSQILETGTPLEKGQAPILKVVETKESIAMETRLGRLDAARSGMDVSNIRARSGVGAVESEPANGFVRAENLTAIQNTLKTEVVQKLGAASGVEAVAKVSRELDPTRELLVDKEVLANLRAVADPKSEIGKALLASPALPNDPQTEYQVIKSRLSLEDGVRFGTFIAVEQHLLASGAQSDASGIWKVITDAPIEALSGKLTESLNEARISRIDRLLGALTDEEHQDFLTFFELTTRQSLGQALIQGVPVRDSRAETLMRLAESRNLTSADVQRLLTEPVPADRKARAEALARTLDNDTKRPAVDPKLVEEVARSYGYEYETLRAAASVAAEQGRPGLVAEITEKMRAHESRVNGTISRTVSAMDPSYLARQGVRESLKSATEQVYDTHSKRVYSNSSVIASTAREVAALLRPEKPNNDAAFNRMRQANLSEEESLYLRALYAQEAGKAALGEGFRSLSGILAKDLEPLGTVLEAEKARIACLAKGGPDSLFQADLRTLDRASIEHNEKRQLETLVNLRASGQYEQAKAKIDKTTLAPAAAEYHKAVSSGDKVKADTADIAVKAKNGDLKPEEVAAFVKDKKSEDFARINRENPQLMQQIQASNPAFFDTGAAKLLSDKEAERKKAVEQVMLKTLTDPMLFNAWLNVAQTKEAKVELVRNLEALIEKQPNAPQFVANNEPKIVQYVRAQKTDFREIDAQLINTIIVSTLSTGEPLKPEVVERLRTLRAEATAQLTTMDVFHDARNAVLSGAKDIEKAIESYQVWAKGSEELRKIEIGSFEWITNSEGKRQKEEARAKILSELRERYPELKNRTDAQIEQGEHATRWHWRSGYILDKPIALTAQRLDAQRQLIAPMEGGVRDIRQSRELVRAGFALMAKDAVAEVNRGLSPDATENVMTLLRQRDLKITYKVTDEKAQRDWSGLVESAQAELDAKDRWTNAGLMVGKIGVCLIASVAVPATAPMWVTWAAPLGVAMLWNGGDKLVRHYKGGENWDSLAKSFLIEGVVDVICFVAAFKYFGPLASGGQAAKQTGTEVVKASKTVVEGPLTRWFSRNSVERILKKPLIVHAEELAANMPKWLKEVVRDYGKKSAAKAYENAVEKATKAGITRADDLARAGAEAVDKMSKWVEVSAKGKRVFVTLPPFWDNKSTDKPRPPLLSDDPSNKKKLDPLTSGTVGVTPPKVSDSEYPTPPPPKKAEPSTPPNPPPTPPPPVIPAITLDDLLDSAKNPSRQNTTPSQGDPVQPTNPPTIPAVTSLTPPVSTDPTQQIATPPTIGSGDGKSGGGGSPGAVSGNGTAPGGAPGPGSGSGEGPSAPPASPAPGPGPSGDGSGRGILVSPPSPTSQANPGGIGTATAAPTPVGNANSGASANVTPNAQGNPVGNPSLQVEANPNGMPNGNPSQQAVPAINPLAQPASIELSLDTAMTRPALQSAVMNDALRQSELVAPNVAIAEGERGIEHRLQTEANTKTVGTDESKKNVVDEEVLKVLHKREGVAMKESVADEKLAAAEGEGRERVATAAANERNERVAATKVEEMVREVARVGDAVDFKKVEAVTLKEVDRREFANVASAREAQREDAALPSRAAETIELATKSVAREAQREDTALPSRAAETIELATRPAAREAQREDTALPNRAAETIELATRPAAREARREDMALPNRAAETIELAAKSVAREAQREDTALPSRAAETMELAKRSAAPEAQREDTALPSQARETMELATRSAAREVQREDTVLPIRAGETIELVTKSASGAYESSSLTTAMFTAATHFDLPVAEQIRSVPGVTAAYVSPRHAEPASNSAARASMESRTESAQAATQAAAQQTPTTAHTSPQRGASPSPVTETKGAEQASAAKVSTSGRAAPSYVAPPPVAMVVSNGGASASGKMDTGASNGNDDSDDAGVAADPKRARKPRTARDDARMRQLILQQLMSQHATRSQREKLLKALLALGISEVEYRKLVSKLGEMDAMRLAQQQVDRRKFAEPVAIAHEAPEIKEEGEARNVESTPTPTPKSQTTRAQLYQRLKEESATSRKRVGS
jgi:hypothetical protein